MDKKIIIGVFLFTVLIIGGGIAISSNLPSKATLSSSSSAKLEFSHKSYDLKTIHYDSGVVTHSFPIINMGKGDLEIANLSTSCMCTTVYLKSKEGKSEAFGMKGMSKASNFIGRIKPGEKAEVIAVFDPTYHGPQGVGPVSRLVSFETNDPDNPYVELSFSGTVVR